MGNVRSAVSFPTFKTSNSKSQLPQSLRRSGLCSAVGSAPRSAPRTCTTLQVRRYRLVDCDCWPVTLNLHSHADPGALSSAPATLRDPRGSCTCDIECVRSCVGAWVVCTCVRSCVRAWCCVWRGWRWLTSFDLTFDVPTGTVGRQSLPRSQSAFDDIFQSAHERGRGVVTLSLSNHFAITPRPSPPVVPFDRKGSQSPCWIPVRKTRLFSPV